MSGMIPRLHSKFRDFIGPSPNSILGNNGQLSTMKIPNTINTENMSANYSFNFNPQELTSAQYDWGPKPLNCPDRGKQIIKQEVINQSITTTPLQTPLREPSIDCLIDRYPMNSTPRGHMLIVNNIDFDSDSLEKREGSDNDVETLQNVFCTQLEFKIEEKKNLKYVAMRNAIQSFAKDPKHLTADMFALCILSHGNGRGIQGTCGCEVERDKIIEWVNHSNLIGKPKLIIFQACSGSLTDPGITKTDTETETKTETETDCAPSYRPSLEDTLIVHASNPGFKSYRDIRTGTWLIQSICEVFSKYAINTELQDMMKIVAKKISDKESDGNKQGIEVSSRNFYKHLYFNPPMEDIKSHSKEKIRVKPNHLNVISKCVESEAKEMSGTLPSNTVSRHYSMNYGRRGKALIFNQIRFKNQGLSVRNGSEKDCESLKVSLGNLGFEVEVQNDLKKEEIENYLSEVAQEDHSDAACICVVALTHGDGKNVWAFDMPFNPEVLWGSFFANKCPTLIGKPKIFIIQACRGDKKDPGVSNIKTDGEDQNGRNINSKIPSHADILVAYSTVEGYVSMRDPENGSCFIQSLVKILQTDGMRLDLVNLLTRVNQMVALDFVSKESNSKQMPCLNSTLTRRIFFGQCAEDK